MKNVLSTTKDEIQCVKMQTFFFVQVTQDRKRTVALVLVSPTEMLHPEKLN